MRTLIDYVVLYSPAIVSVLGVIITVLTSIKKMVDAFGNNKELTEGLKKQIAELEESNELKEIKELVKQTQAENLQLRKDYDELMVELTRVRKHAKK